MYQPYPTGAQLPEVEKPTVPAQVKSAVTAMYVGAAATVAAVVIEILTVNATKAAIEKRSPHLTVSQVNATQHALIIGTALFGLATIDTIGSAISPVAGLVKAWWPVIWLAGLIAVIFLWRRPSTEFFKGVWR